MLIHKATAQDIDAIENGYRELLLYEEKHKSWSNWALGVYPTRKTAESALKSDTLYILEDNDQICGSVILNQLQPDEYKEIEWCYKAKDEEVLVIHTRCIQPSMAGKGYGKAMIEFALEQTGKMKCSVIRLDTFAGNEPAAALYKKFGFRHCGTADILLQGLIPEKQIFFEKRVGGMI